MLRPEKFLKSSVFYWRDIKIIFAQIRKLSFWLIKYFSPIHLPDISMLNHTLTLILVTIESADHVPVKILFEWSSIFFAENRFFPGGWWFFCIQSVCVTIIPTPPVSNRLLVGSHQPTPGVTPSKMILQTGTYWKTSLLKPKWHVFIFFPDASRRAAHSWPLWPQSKQSSSQQRPHQIRSPEYHITPLRWIAPLIKLPHDL